MSFLFWTFTFFFSIYLIFRIFGRYIIKFVLHQIIRKVAKDTQEQAQAFHQNYGRSPYEDPVYISDELEISQPKHQENDKVEVDEIVEDIDFEDVTSSKVS